MGADRTSAARFRVANGSAAGSVAERAPKVLLIGPLPDASEAIGGSKVTFFETVRGLQGTGLEVEVLNTTRPRANRSAWRKRANDLAAFARTIRSVLPRLRDAHAVVLNMSVFGAWFVVPCLWTVCRLARAPLVLRFFGNGQGVRKAGWLTTNVIERCPLVYVETQRLRASLDAPNVRWLPNARDLSVCRPPNRRPLTKIAFVAQLRMAKGLAEALEACRRLPADCRLDVFGPRMPDTDMSLFDGHPKAAYGGVLPHEEVAQALARHDLLLFPSYWATEGYPGIVVEAFQAGLPVVAARWNDIGELVEHGRNGLLVEPRSAEALRAAIARLFDDPALYERLCEGARDTGRRFRSSYWYPKVARDLLTIVTTRRALAPAG